MLQTVEDRFLPPDRDEFVRSEPPTGRIIVIAPTRAACETIEIAFTLHIETFLEKQHGERVRELARNLVNSGRGFGIVAGTGTGKTLAVRPIAEEILRAPLRVGVVNREREATPELPLFNVLIVTTGIARRWFQDGDILPRDTLVVDEIHQTSAELELCLALGKRVGCRFVWLSATVDPKFYRDYLNSSDVLQVFAFDADRAATVQVLNRQPVEFFDDARVKSLIKQKRGVGAFLPTRAGVEQIALDVGERFPKLNTAFYHGGEPIRQIRPFLEAEGAPRPFLLSMTAAGQSALNVRGLDTVVIDDTRFAIVIQKGRGVLTRLPLGNNEILQMAGRVHGRVENGRVFLLSNRDIDFWSLQPTAPDFQLAGDSERVALTCADLGVRADELELPVPLDKTAYRRALTDLQIRGLVTQNGRLSAYGKKVEALPVDRPWAELIVHADADLIPAVAVMSALESLHRMTREDPAIGDLVVSGSDHLTTYNLYADAFHHAGFVGEVYGLERHLFESEAMEKWAEERGVLIKAIEDAALAMASALRSAKIPLPREMPLVNEKIERRFRELVAQIMPFDLVINEETASGEWARVSRSSVCESRGAIAGTLSYFADRNGVTRAFIEGTEIPFRLVRENARSGAVQISYDARRPAQPLVATQTREYFGFVLERESEALRDFDAEIAPQARRALAEALARGEAHHMAVKPHRAQIEEIRELYRRSGGQLPRLGFRELADLYEKQLEAQNIESLLAFRNARLEIRVEEFFSEKERANLWALPSEVRIRKQKVQLEYDVEGNESDKFGVVRLRLPANLAFSLRESELPKLDRPLRFAAVKSNRVVARADSLEALHEQLEAAWDEAEPTETAPREITRREARKPKPTGRATNNSRRGGRSGGSGGRGSGRGKRR